MTIPQILFSLSKTPLLDPFVGAIFEYASFLLPLLPILKITANNEKVISFKHPKPEYPNHIVLVPKKAIPNFLSLIQDVHINYLFDILQTARYIIDNFSEYRENNWLLRVNGGIYQDVSQVHFHLSTDEEDQNIMDKYEKMGTEDTFEVFSFSDPKRQKFFMVPFEPLELDVNKNAQQKNIIKDMISCFQVLDRKYDLTRKGYTLIFREIIKDKKKRGLVLHVSGERSEGKKP